MTELNATQKAYRENVTNFTQNIEPIMKKLRDRKKLSSQECDTLVSYYVEVTHLLMSLWIEKLETKDSKVIITFEGGEQHVSDVTDPFQGIDKCGTIS